MNETLGTPLRKHLDIADRPASVWFSSRCALKALGEFNPRVVDLDQRRWRFLLSALRATICGTSASALSEYDLVRFAREHTITRAFENAADLVYEILSNEVREIVDSSSLAAGSVVLEFHQDAAVSAAIHARNVNTSMVEVFFDDLRRKGSWHPIWPASSSEHLEAFINVNLNWSHPGFSFWKEWYLGFLDGKPLDWELQRRVALIPDENWERGPEWIAKKIEEIRAKYDAELAAIAVENYLKAQSLATVESGINSSMIGHNQPPEGERLPIAQPDLDMLYVHVQAVRQQMRADEIDVAKVEYAQREIEKTEGKLRDDLARRLGLATDEFAKQFGKHGATAAWGAIGASTFWALGLLEKLSPLVEFVRKVVAMLLG